MKGYLRQDYGVSAANSMLLKAVNDGIATSQISGKTGKKVPFLPRGLSLPEGMQDQDTVFGLFQRGR
eukprot:15056-Alexandrium_andersonii.AAC.1